MDRLAYFLFLSIALLFSTCKKEETPPDPCASCVAPFQCVDGDCIEPCSAGLIDCGDLDCVNGECVCPRGFEGPDCDEEKTPRQIYIEEIWVYDFPATRSTGEAWDEEMNDGTGPAPDIFPWVNEDDNRTRYISLTIEDASPDDVHIFRLTDVEAYQVNLTGPIENTGFGLWDRDGTREQDEYLYNTAAFLPYEEGRPGFPNRDTITLDTIAQVVIRYGF